MIGTPEKVRLNSFLLPNLRICQTAIHEQKLSFLFFNFSIPVCCILQPNTSFQHVDVKVSLKYVFPCIVSPAAGIVMTSHFCRLPIRQNGGETVTNWISIEIWPTKVVTCLRILSKLGCFFSSAPLDVGLRSADAQDSVLSGGEFLVLFHGIEFHISANSVAFFGKFRLNDSQKWLVLSQISQLELWWAHYFRRLPIRQHIGEKCVNWITSNDLICTRPTALLLQERWRNAHLIAIHNSE